MAEQPDGGALHERVSRLGAAVAERRNELTQTRERIGRLRNALEDALSSAPAIADAHQPTPNDAHSLSEFRAAMAERDAELRAARRQIARLETELASAQDRLERGRTDWGLGATRLERLLEQADGQLDQLTSQLVLARRELEQAVAVIEERNAVLAELREQARTADERIGAAVQRQRLAERREQEGRAAVARAAAARADAAQGREDAERMMTLARRIADEATAASDLALERSDADREQARRLQARVDHSKAELGRAEQLLRTRGEELEAARRELDRARRGVTGGPRWAASAPSYRLSAAPAPAADTARVRELEQQISLLVHGLATTRSDLERVQASKAWRFGHGVMASLMRIRGRRPKTRGAVQAALDRIERLEEAHAALGGASLREAARVIETAPLTPARALLLAPGERERDPAERRALAEEIRGRLGPASDLTRTPTVSAVVPTRNGRQLLEHLVVGLTETTDYPLSELIVVDNDSSDGSAEYLDGLDLSFPIRVISNEQNVSFSDACNQGAALSESELLLFLNNDIEAFEPGWLHELVALVLRAEVVAAGATLIYGQELQDVERRGWTVQHRGVRFACEGADLKAFNVDDGGGLFDAGFGGELRCPALTAACLLVERERFEQVGGFSAGYHYGTEDVDLGLKLAAGGGFLVCSGRSVLFHEQSATQLRTSDDISRIHRRANLKLLHERWGPLIRRRYRLGALDGDRFWAGEHRPHIGITLTSHASEFRAGDWYTAHEMGEALNRVGWQVTYLQREGDEWYRPPPGLDYLLTTIDAFDARLVPPGVVVIAWIRNWTERWLERPWFSRLDLLLASSARSAELIEQATGRPTIRFPLATNPRRFSPRAPVEEVASDYVLTGNYWRTERDIVAALDPQPDERLLLFGHRWEEVERMRPYARGPVAYDRLPDVYASAKLVLDDTAGPTLRYGAVNSRVFDALACGRLPITNCEEGVHELFDDEFPTWSSRETLRAQLDALLADERRREHLAERYRTVVLQRHTYDERARELAAALRERGQQPSFCIKIGAPTWEAAERWGDLYFARALEAELKRRGHCCRIQVLDEWEELSGLDDDVVIHLKGLTRYRPKPGQRNVLWSISHPDELSIDECDIYDLVCVASRRFAQELAGRTRTPVVVLEQATDPRVFFPDPSPGFEDELVFVGNSRNVLRRIVRDTLSTSRRLTVYGSNWEELIDRRLIAGEFVANEELRKVYSSAAIVLADHWDDMREHGFVSNRIFDALACGAVVISDHLEELPEHFGDSVITYDSPERLDELIDRMLADPDERAARGARGRELVLAEHTFAHRVDVLLGELARLEEPSVADRQR